MTCWRDPSLSATTDFAGPSRPVLNPDLSGNYGSIFKVLIAQADANLKILSA
ncbi:hypothetical protein KKC74_02425 [bacterium]|nr:hypothetical protein [bacterium]MBU1872686.1 hypothetical protein [bacterium]